MDGDQVRELLEILAGWRDSDEPMVEAIGDALAASMRLDSQERARRVLDAVIRVLETELTT